MYAGTVTLGMSEDEFWRSTPRKLMALLEVHRRIYQQPEEREAFIDEIL